MNQFHYINVFIKFFSVYWRSHLNFNLKSGLDKIWFLEKQSSSLLLLSMLYQLFAQNKVNYKINLQIFEFKFIHSWDFGYI